MAPLNCSCKRANLCKWRVFCTVLYFLDFFFCARKSEKLNYKHATRIHSPRRRKKSNGFFFVKRKQTEKFVELYATNSMKNKKKRAKVWVISANFQYYNKMMAMTMMIIVLTEFTICFVYAFWLRERWQLQRLRFLHT